MDCRIVVSPVTIEQHGDAVRFPVRVQPRASRTEIVGELGGAIRIRLQAPPVDGAANDALVQFLARTFGVGRRDVRIVSGMSSRSKLVEIDGIAREDVERLTETT